MDLTNLIISLISGLVGGNVAGAFTKDDQNLGTLGNSISGLVGGGLGGWILKALGVLGAATATHAAGAPATPEMVGGMDISSLLANIGGSGVGGAILTAVVGLIKNSMNK